MTIAYQNSGAAATGTSSLSIPYPSSISAGNLLICSIASKGGSSPTTPPTKPSGWELICRRNGGLGAAGVDSGTVWQTVFAKIADGTESGNLSVTTSGDATNGSAVGHIERWTYDTSKQVVVAAATGTDTTGSSTAFSAAGSNAIDFAGTDILVGFFATNTDGTTAFTGQQFSATGGSGSTLSGGSITNLGTFVASDGYDIGMGVFYATTTGWSGSRTVTLAATGTNSGTNNQTGAAVILRMREVDYALPALKDFRSGAAATLAYIGGVSEGDLLVLTIHGRFDSATFSGWTQLATASGTSGSEATDTGTGRVTSFYKVADGTENDTTFSPSITNGTSVSLTLHVFGRPVGAVDSWQVLGAGAGDSNGGTTFTVTTTGTDFPFNIGDIISAAAGINTDAYSFSGHAFSATGVTFSAVSELLDLAQTAGNDSRAVVAVASVTAGHTFGSTDGPLTYTSTASGSTANAPCGGVSLFRVRLNVPAEITTQPSNQTANVGATAVFTVIADGTAVAYQWQEGIVSTDADFQFSNPNGTTLEAIDSKWDMNSTSLETNGSGQLQTVAGSVWVDVTARYADSQPDTQFFEMVIKAGGFDSGQYRRGYLQHDGTNEGYRFEVGGSSVSISRDGSYANAGPHSIDPTTADYTLRGEYNHLTGLVRLLVNGVETLTYTDESPLTGGCPALGMYSAGTPSNCQIESFKCTSSTGSSSWSDISGETSATFETDTLALEDDGKQFRVRVYNDYASQYSSTVTLTVEEGGITGTIAVTDAGPDTSAITGGVLVEGALSVTEQYLEDAADITGKVVVQGGADTDESGSDVFAATGLTPIEGTADFVEASVSDSASIWGDVYTDAGYSPTARVGALSGSHSNVSAGGTAEIVLNGSEGQTALVILGLFGSSTTTVPVFTMPAGWDLVDQSATVNNLNSAAYTKKLEENTSSVEVQSDLGGVLVAQAYTLDKVSSIAHALFQATNSKTGYNAFDPPEVDTNMGTQNYLRIAGALVPSSATALALTGQPSGYYEAQKEYAPGSVSSTIALRTARQYDAQSNEVHDPSAGFIGDGKALSNTYITWTFAITPEILGEDVALTESGSDESEIEGIVRSPIFGQMDIEEAGSDTSDISGAGIVQGIVGLTESGPDLSGVFGQAYNNLELAPLPEVLFENAGVDSSTGTSFEIPVVTDIGRQSLLILAGSNTAVDCVLSMPSPWVKLGQTARFGTVAVFSAVFYNPEVSAGSVTVTSDNTVSLSYIEYSFNRGAKITGTSAGRSSGTGAPNPPSHSTGFGAQNSVWVEYFALKPNSAAGILAPSPGYVDLQFTGVHPGATGSTAYSAIRYLQQTETEDPAAVAGWNNASSGPSPASMWTISVIPGVAGSLSSSESGSDTAFFVGGSVRFGDVDAVESGSDTPSFSGDVIIKGTAALQEEGADTLAASGGVIVKGTALLQEADSDTVSIIGGALVEGDAPIQEAGSDTASIAGKVFVDGTLSANETGSDIANISGGNQIQGSIGVTESSPDALAATGDVLVQGVFSVTDSADTAEITGGISSVGSLSATEVGSDLATVIGTNMLQGYVMALEVGSDISSVVGKIFIEGDVNASEPGQDVASISGASVINGSINLQEVGADTVSVLGDVEVHGVLGATDSYDVATVHGQIVVKGSAAFVESGGDTANMLGLVVTGAVMNAVEQGSDGATADGEVLIQGVLNATDVRDNVAVNGDVLVKGGLSVQESGTDSAISSGSVYWSGNMSASEVGPDVVVVVGRVITDGNLSATESGSDTAELMGVVFWTPLEGVVNATEQGQDDATILGESVVYTTPRSWLVAAENREFEINAEDRSFTVKA